MTPWKRCIYVGQDVTRELENYECKTLSIHFGMTGYAFLPCDGSRKWDFRADDDNISFMVRRGALFFTPVEDEK